MFNKEKIIRFHHVTDEGGTSNVRLKISNHNMAHTLYKGYVLLKKYTLTNMRPQVLAGKRPESELFKQIAFTEDDLNTLNKINFELDKSWGQVLMTNDELPDNKQSEHIL